MTFGKLARCALALILIAIGGAALAAEETIDWGSMKNLYHSNGGTPTASVITPTSYWLPDDCPLQLTSKPTSFCWQLPDGSWVSIIDLLGYVQSKTPEYAVWETSGFLDLRRQLEENPEISGLGERGWWGKVWKWVKDHVTCTINYFGLAIEVTGSTPGDCVQITWNWYENTFYFGPCLP